MTFRECARRIVAEEIAPSMTHQRVSQLAKSDPEFPPIKVIGSSKVVDWTVARLYFAAHAAKAAARDRRRRPE